MDPNPKNFPILSYVMAKIPSFGPRRAATSSAASDDYDIEQPAPRTPSKEPHFELTEQMPHLTDPKVVSTMRAAVADVAQTRSVLKNLGIRPDHEAVDAARVRLAEIDAELSNKLEEIVLSPTQQQGEGSVRRSDKEEDWRKAAEEERDAYKAVIALEEMHEAYQKMLNEAERRLEKIYESAISGGEVAVEDDNANTSEEEVNEEVVAILQESGKGIDKVDLSGRQLKMIPEAFGRIQSLVVLNLSNNQLEGIPDSIAGLQNLAELNLSSNLLELLPDSIGMLFNLMILDVSSNKLTALPDSISHCRSLVELDASFNKLSYLPTNIGYELTNLRRLSIQLNKICSLPTSIGEMKSLCILDVHFNELRGLPRSIGRLASLEILNLGSNFSDLTELPDTIGDLSNLKELDLSNNQIHELPDTFGRLDNLTKLNIEQNPLVIPPEEVVNEGVAAIKEYMIKIRLDKLMGEDRMSSNEENEQGQANLLSRSTSWLNNFVTNVSGYLGANPKEDPYLNQQL